MKKTNFITIKEFTVRNDMTVPNVHICRKNGLVPDCAFDVLSEPYLIDEEYFLRRDKFARDVYLEAQENYYSIYEYIPNNAAISRLAISLGSTRSFLSVSQFFIDVLFDFLTCVRDRLVD